MVYPPRFYSDELKLAFKGRLTWKVADTLQYIELWGGVELGWGGGWVRSGVAGGSLRTTWLVTLAND